MAARELAVVDPEIAALRDINLLGPPGPNDVTHKPVSVERLSARRLRQLSASPLERLSTPAGPLLGRHRSMHALKPTPTPDQPVHRDRIPSAQA